MKKRNICRRSKWFTVAILILGINSGLYGYGEAYNFEYGSPYAWVLNLTKDDYSVSFTVRSPGAITNFFGYNQLQTKTIEVSKNSEGTVDLSGWDLQSFLFETLTTPRIGYKDSVITVSSKEESGDCRNEEECFIKYMSGSSISMKMDQQGGRKDVRDEDEKIGLRAQWRVIGKKEGWYFTIYPLYEEEEIKTSKHKKPGSGDTYIYRGRNQEPEKKEANPHDDWF